MPISEGHLHMFIDYLDIRDYAPATIVTYVSALSYCHKIKASLTHPTLLLPVNFSSQLAKTNPKGNRYSTLPWPCLKISYR